MGGVGALLYRDKMVPPVWARALMGAVTFAPIVATTVATLTGADPAILLAGAAGTSVAGVAALLFAVLRVAVSEQEVHVQYGPLGPRIPIDEVESADVVEYSILKYGGFGIRLGLDGSMIYNMLGDGQRAVRFRLAKGRPSKTILVASRDPEALAAAVNEALRRRSGGGGARVRVAPELADASAPLAQDSDDEVLTDEEEHTREAS